MNQLKNILVGLDFSECSRCALHEAASLARGNEARLHLIHVVDSTDLDPADTPLPPELQDLRRVRREHALGRLAEWAREAGVPDDQPRDVMSGSPLEVLLEGIKRRQADLLVLGVIGDSPAPHGSGTLAAKCLRKSATKVLLVKQTHPRPFQRVVACVDFSETSHEVVLQALRVAERERAQAHFLHVFQPEWHQWSPPSEWSALADFEARHRASLEERLRGFVAVPPGVEARFSVVQAKSHAQGIAEHCRQVGADLVVLGRRGRSVLREVLLGSTVERLLKDPPCSVLVVRTPEARAESGPASGAGL